VPGPQVGGVDRGGVVEDEGAGQRALALGRDGVEHPVVDVHEVLVEVG
jgi:hypothetical protein